MENTSSTRIEQALQYSQQQEKWPRRSIPVKIAALLHTRVPQVVGHHGWSLLKHVLKLIESEDHDYIPLMAARPVLEDVAMSPQSLPIPSPGQVLLNVWAATLRERNLSMLTNV